MYHSAITSFCQATKPYNKNNKNMKNKNGKNRENRKTRRHESKGFMHKLRESPSKIGDAFSASASQNLRVLFSIFFASIWHSSPFSPSPLTLLNLLSPLIPHFWCCFITLPSPISPISEDLPLNPINMGSLSPNISWDYPFTPKTIADFLRRISTMTNASERLSRLDDFVKNLEEEMKKIDAFKRELPFCMLLLNDGEFFFSFFFLLAPNSILRDGVFLVPFDWCFFWIFFCGGFWI